VRALLEGGKAVSYGAKAIPEGGWYAMPKLYADGLLLCGDTAGFLNGGRLKGIHLAIKSGMLAAEQAFECLLAGDFSAAKLAGYEKRVADSWAGAELAACATSTRRSMAGSGPRSRAPASRCTWAGSTRSAATSKAMRVTSACRNCATSTRTGSRPR
jgi:flavin-dependent dehydrogenase